MMASRNHMYALGTEGYCCMHWVLRDTDVCIGHSKILMYALGTEGYWPATSGVFGVT